MRWGAPEPGSYAEDAFKLYLNYDGTFSRIGGDSVRTTASDADALSAAILAGLIRFPAEIARHAEALAACPGLDPRFDLLIDASDHGQALESEGLATILSRQGQAVPSPMDYSGMRFGFLSADAAPAQACAEMAQAIELLVERPALETALADATERLNREFTDEAYAEQQRLLKRKLEFESRLGQMASARAALPSGDASKTMAE